MKRIVLLIVMLMGVVTVAQERIPRLIPRDYNNVPAAVPVWYDTTTGTYKYYQDNSASILDALSSGVPVSYDTVAAGDSVVSTVAYGTWEFENHLDDGASLKFIYLYNGAVGYTFDYAVAVGYAIRTVAGATIGDFSYSSAKNGDNIKIHRTINGTFYVTVNNEMLGSCIDNTIRGCDSIYVTDGYVANLIITPLTLLDVTKDLSKQNAELKLQVDSLVTLTTPSSNSYGVLRTTTGTTIDSVAFGFDTQTITFINDGTTSDTLYVSTSSNFPATNVMVRLGGEGFTKRMKTNKLYFKVGNVPLAGKKIRIEGY